MYGAKERKMHMRYTGNIVRVGVNQLRRKKKKEKDTIVRSPVPCMFHDTLFCGRRTFMAYPRRQILDTPPRPKGITI